MEQYDIDFEIINSIRTGHHQFNEIWRKTKFKGSLTTFSKHLNQLVEARYIQKKMENKKPRYYLGNNTTPFDTDKGFINQLKNEISTIKEKSKKIPDKELLNEFINDTQDLLIVLSQLNFSQLTFMESYNKEKIEHSKPDISVNEKKIELINKLITMRIKILNERDSIQAEKNEKDLIVGKINTIESPKLFMTFFSLIQDRLQNFLSQNSKK